MGSNLKSRLAHIRAVSALSGRGGSGLHSAPAASSPESGKLRPREEQKPPAFLAGWERCGDFVWSRRTRYPCRFPVSIDPAVFASLAECRQREGAANPRLATSSLRFFDLETTGLSGGAGTIAFLAAVGRIDDSGLCVRQLFLEDHPGEPLFLELLLGELEEDSTILTYNGRAFDMPLVRGRCVLNGMTFAARRHIDVLVAARRLWRKSFGGAALGLLERELLGLGRQKDIAGCLIPEIWLRFARGEGDGELDLVARHNADDIRGLAELAAAVDFVCAAPLARAVAMRVDRAALGCFLLALHREDEGRALLRSALDEGDWRAGLSLAKSLRKAGSTRALGQVLELLLRIEPENYRCCLELAWFEEHCAHDIEAALRSARRAETFARTKAERDRIGTRIERLSRAKRRLESLDRQQHGEACRQAVRRRP